jgi:hypothetical protein
MYRLATALALCWTLQACGSRNRPLATGFDAVLDSLTPSLRLGDNPAAVQRKLPGFRLLPDRSYQAKISTPAAGPAGLSLFFEGYMFGAPQPALRVARLEGIYLSFPQDTQYVRIAGSLARWLGREPDTLCRGTGERQLRVLRWRSGGATTLQATAPGPGAPHGFIEIATTMFDSTPRLGPAPHPCAA